MLKHTYDVLKQVEAISVDTSSITINSVSLFEVDEILVHDIEHELVLLRFMSENSERANIIVRADQALYIEGTNFEVKQA